MDGSTAYCNVRAIQTRYEPAGRDISYRHNAQKCTQCRKGASIHGVQDQSANSDVDTAVLVSSLKGWPTTNLRGENASMPGE